MPITPAKPNPSACGMLRFHPNRALRRATILFGQLYKSLEGMAIARNLNLEMAVRMETDVGQLRGRLLLPLSGGI
ncbi:hypothetical protein [Bradyrhizobium sp. LM2.9]